MADFVGVDVGVNRADGLGGERGTETVLRGTDPGTNKGPKL